MSFSFECDQHWHSYSGPEHGVEIDFQKVIIVLNDAGTPVQLYCKNQKTTLVTTTTAETPKKGNS